MAAPYLDTWNPLAKVSAHTALLTTLASGSVNIYDSADTLLGSVALDDPVGTVDSETGALTLVPAADGEWAESGTAAYATLYDGDTPTANAMQSLSCQAGTEAVTGKCVLSTLTTVSGKPFALVSWVVT
jgi:hypothetical protein